jgi:hypothetical protein
VHRLGGIILKDVTSLHSTARRKLAGQRPSVRRQSLSSFLGRRTEAARMQAEVILSRTSLGSAAVLEEEDAQDARGEQRSAGQHPRRSLVLQQPATTPRPDINATATATTTCAYEADSSITCKRIIVNAQAQACRLRTLPSAYVRESPASAAAATQPASMPPRSRPVSPTRTANTLDASKKVAQYRNHVDTGASGQGQYIGAHGRDVKTGKSRVLEHQ